jgi:hypothetical protein
MQLYALQYAGYPFAPDDLTLEQWLDLASYKEVIDACRMKEQFALSSLLTTRGR